MEEHSAAVAVVLHESGCNMFVMYVHGGVVRKGVSTPVL